MGKQAKGATWFRKNYAREWVQPSISVEKSKTSDLYTQSIGIQCLALSRNCSCLRLVGDAKVEVDTSSFTS